MNKISTIIISIIGIILIIMAVVWSQKNKTIDGNQSLMDRDQIEASIKTLITNFGDKLKNVSLLASSTALQNQIRENYTPYLTPEFLTKLTSEPNLALGRSVSSPWPERIEIASLSPLGEDRYMVEANVIEVSSFGTSTQIAGIYPVTFTVEKRASSWLISDIKKGDYSEIPKKVTVTGKGECLPHKNPGEIQTLECAFGLLEDKTGKHYAVDLRLIENGQMDFPTGTRVRVTGTMVPANQLNSDMWQKYNMEGIIAVDKVEKI
jgi:hypothetical protein